MHIITNNQYIKLYKCNYLVLLYPQSLRKVSIRAICSTRHVVEVSLLRCLPFLFDYEHCDESANPDAAHICNE